MSRDAYQRKRAESYKCFSGAIVQYQAIAGLLKKKKYLQYFLIDTAITPVFRKLYENKLGKKLQECTDDELGVRTISDFIDSTPDDIIIQHYQLHHGPEGSDEYIAARALFMRKAKCTFEMSLADTANELMKTVGRPLDRLLSWSEEYDRPQWKDHGIFEEIKTQAVFKDDALTREDFLCNDTKPQQPTIVLDNSQQEQTSETPCHYAIIESIEERDACEERVEKLEHAAKLRHVVLEEVNVTVEPPNVTERQDYNESVELLVADGFRIGIYAPPQSGKNVYLKGRRHQLLSTDEFRFSPYKSVSKIARSGIITSDVELAAKASISVAIIPSWDVFRYRHYKVRLKTSEHDYRTMLSRLGRYDYVLFTNKYVSQAMATFD